MENSFKFHSNDAPKHPLHPHPQPRLIHWVFSLFNIFSLACSPERNRMVDIDNNIHFHVHNSKVLNRKNCSHFNQKNKHSVSQLANQLASHPHPHSTTSNECVCAAVWQHFFCLHIYEHNNINTLDIGIKYPVAEKMYKNYTYSPSTPTALPLVKQKKYIIFWIVI